MNSGTKERVRAGRSRRISVPSGNLRGERLSDLEKVLAPRAVAVIGASVDSTRISGRPVHLLLQHQFSGAIYPVNPKYRQIEGLPSYGTVADIGKPVDLAIVVTPAAAVLDVVEQCAAAGVRAAMILSSGFGESGPSGRLLEDRLRQIAQGSGIRIAGPNSEGFFNLTHGVAAGFSPAMDYERGLAVARQGPIGVVAQSGGMGFALFNRGLDLGLGFSKVISTGNEVDLDFLDYLGYLVQDSATRVILAFLEGLRHPERFREVATAAAQARKPIILSKVGRSEAARRAAQSHTGSMAGEDRVYDAVFRQWGLIRVDDLDDMLDMAMYFSLQQRRLRGRRFAILTGSGGGGVWLTDGLVQEGLQVPELDAEVQSQLRGFVPAYGSTSNPVDLTAQAASGGGIEKALTIVGRSDGIDAVAMIMALTPEDRMMARRPLLEEAIASIDKPVINFSYRPPTERSAEIMADLGIPYFLSPMRAARCLGQVYRYEQRIEHMHRPIEPNGFDPPLPPHDIAWTEAAAKTWLQHCGFPITRERLASSPAAAVAAAEALGYPVAIKVQSPAILHKSDIGGVQLNLTNAEAVQTAYAEVCRAGGRTQMDGVNQIEGVLVQEMVPDGVEMILGAVHSDFGPIVMLGFGGVYAEAIRDTTMRLAPVDRDDVREMLAELRGRASLENWRGRPESDVEALIDVVVRFSHCAWAWKHTIAEMEVNPLMVRRKGRGVVVVDAAIVPIRPS